MRRSFPVVTFLGLAVIVGGAFFWWQWMRPAPKWIRPAPATTTATAPQGPPAPVVVPAPAIGRPAFHYAVPAAPSPRAALPALDRADGYVESALADLLGRKAVQSFLRLDGFARKLVATVNNLATDNAAAQMWPVNPTGGKLATETRDGGLVISASNAERYAAFVHFAESVDTQRAVALYVRLYPLFQRAYEELGYPGQYFNDRVVEVIDNLLATPRVAEPIKVRRISVDGVTPTADGLYVFEDPLLEASTAGQKILLRMGREDAGKLMAKLTDIRQRLVRSAITQSPPAVQHSPHRS